MSKMTAEELRDTRSLTAILTRWPNETVVRLLNHIAELEAELEQTTRVVYADFLAAVTAQVRDEVLEEVAEACLRRRDGLRKTPRH